MRTVTATPPKDSSQAQRLELLHLLERFETAQSDALVSLCRNADDATRRLADRRQVPSYLVVEPQDPAPVVERTLLAVLRRLSSVQR